MATKTTKAELELLLEEAKAALAAVTAERDHLRGRLDAGIAAFKTARAEIASLKETIAKRQVVFVRPRAEPKPVVTRFYRNGVLWEKTRIGNDARERRVEGAADRSDKREARPQ